MWRAALWSFALLWLFALTMPAVAQRTPMTESDLTAKLTSDLLVLQSVLVGTEPLQDEIYSRTELQSLITYSQNKVVNAYRNDVRSFETSHLPRAVSGGYGGISFGTFVSPDQAYKLTRVLAGKELSEQNLAPLTQAITGIVVSAIACREAECPVQDSSALRSAAQQAYDALAKLDVSNHDIRVVIDALLRGAQTLAAKPQRTTTIFK